MIALITHSLKVVHAVVREHSKLITRSSKWGGVRKTALKANPKCACCESTSFLQVHHMVSFKHDPALELDPKNLIVLCMGPNECHLLIGHGDNFKLYNPYVAADVLNVKSKSITLEQAKQNAKKEAIPS